MFKSFTKILSDQSVLGRKAQFLILRQGLPVAMSILMVFSALSSRIYLFLVTLLAACVGIIEPTLAQDSLSTSRRTARTVVQNVRSREPILVPKQAQPPGLQFQAYEENAILAIAGRQYQLAEKIASGGSGIVYDARDLQTQELVAIKLSAMSVFAPALYQESEYLKDVRLRPSDFVAFQTQLAALKNLMAKLGDQFVKPLFITTASDVLYLDGQFANNYHLYGERVEFAALVMPHASATLKEKSNHLALSDSRLTSSAEVLNRVKLVLSIYISITQEMAAMAEIGYSHFDIKPANIGFDENTGRFSFLDWESTRKLTALKYNFLKYYEFTDDFTAPEVFNNARFELGSAAYSLGITLMAVLDQSFLSDLGKMHPDTFTQEDLTDRFRKIKKNLKDKQALQDLEIISRFILAATTLDIHYRREALSELNLPTAFKKQLSKERGDAWADGTLPIITSVPKPDFVEPKRPIKAFVDRVRGYLRSSTAVQCIDLVN